MKFKKTLLLLGLCLAPLALNSCGETNSPVVNDFESKTREIYNKAVEAGYEGTYKEWLESIKGEPGVDGKSIKEIKFMSADENNATYLIIFTDASTTEIKIPLTKGPQGDKGDQGEIGPQGPEGPQGPAGEDGKPGQDGETGPQGPVGPQGPQGPAGQDGADGQDGKPGQDGADGQDGKPGQDGADGQDGNDGLSAYEIYLKYHPEYTGTEEEWISDLVSGNLAIRYEVKFMDGNELIYSEEVLHGHNVSLIPKAPIKKGYKFVNWTLNGEEFVKETKIKSDTIINANYIEVINKEVTKVSGTFINKTNINVETTNPGAKDFEKQFDDTVTFDLDYTPNNLYFYGKRVGRELDKEPLEAYEVLLYKDVDVYKYLDSYMGNPITLTDDTRALDYINKALYKLTNRRNAYLDSSIFRFDETENEKAYLYKYFGLSTQDFDETTFEYVYTKTSDLNNVTVNFKNAFLESDAGILAFYTTNPVDENNTSVLNLNVDNGNRVTHFDYKYLPNMFEMPIFTPAPILSLVGNTTFDAVYDKDFSRKLDIPHSAVTVPVTLEVTGTGTAKMYKSAYNELYPRVEIQSGEEVEIGSWITVEPETQFGSKIYGVDCTSGSSLYDDQYVFEVAKKDNNIIARFSTVELASFVIDTNMDTLFKNYTLVAFDLIQNKVSNLITLDKANPKTPVSNNKWAGLFIGQGDPLNDVATDQFNVTTQIDGFATRDAFCMSYNYNGVQGHLYVIQVRTPNIFHIKAALKTA